MPAHHLEDPFVIVPTDALPFTLPRSSSSTVSLPRFSLLAPQLPPSRPALGASCSYKENASTLSLSTATLLSDSKPRPVRRVSFSPTPLASLQSSPNHKRPYATLATTETPGDERAAKRARRNVYSGNPLLEALRRSEMEGLQSAAPISSATSDDSTVSPSLSLLSGGGKDASSPPTSTTSSPLPPPSFQLLPPLRTSALRVDSTTCDAFSPAKPPAFAFTPPAPLRTLRQTSGEPFSSRASEPVMPFSMPGLRPAFFPTPSPLMAEDEDDAATDSETESEAVESLLLPASQSLPSPNVASGFARLLNPPATTASTATSTTTPAEPSSSSSTLSSSPLRSPSRRSTRPSSSSAFQIGPKSILKRRPVSFAGPSGTGLTARNEREGQRQNGRGRKHVLGWEDCRAMPNGTAQAAQDTGERAGAGRATTRAPASGAASGSAASSSSTRRVARGTAEGQRGGDGAEDEQGDDRRRRAPPAGPSQPQESGGSSLGGARTVYAVQADDAILLRTPLLTLKASLRPVSASYVRPADETLAPPLLPRASSASPQADDSAALFETPTFLPDVEEAYVALTQALFRLPAALASPEDTLAPLREFQPVLLAALQRDISNIASFPSWLASQPRLSSFAAFNHGSPGSSSPASSPASSPSRRSAANGQGNGKKSLTEEQMRRMRDELGAAQAAVKCFAAIVREDRVWRLFSDEALSALLELVCSLPRQTSLTSLVQRDLFPFIAFVLSNQRLPASLITPLLTPSLLPCLFSTLTLSPKTDRYRLAMSESLAALSTLISAFPREMLSEGRWKVWFRPAMAGLWDGPKKATSTKERAVRVAGRLVRALTLPLDGADEEWVREREKVQKEVGKEMLIVLHASPPDADKRTNYLKLLLDQLEAPPTSPVVGQHSVDTQKLQTLSILGLLPPFLGNSFRALNDKGIGPWMNVFNRLIDNAQGNTLTLCILCWTQAMYAFFRTTSDKSDFWLFRKPGAKPYEVLIGIFETRGDRAWRKNDTPALSAANPTRKGHQRAHAKALALAFTAFTYGLGIYIRYDATSIRATGAAAVVDAPLSQRRLDLFDKVFASLFQTYLPLLTHTAVSQEAPALGWAVFASILRPRTAVDAAATLEALVNPTFLNGTLGAAKDAQRVALVVAAAMSSAVQPAKVPGWGESWVVSRTGQVLMLFEKCLPSDEEQALLQVVEPHFVVAWQNLLHSLALSDASAPALADAFTWLVGFSGSPAVVAALWSATVSLSEERIVLACERAAKGNAAALEKATGAWLASVRKVEAYGAALARGWTAMLDLLASHTLQTGQLGGILALLRTYSDSTAKPFTDNVWRSFARSVVAAVWSDSPTSAVLCDYVASILTPPSDPVSDIRLCTLLASVCHGLPAGTQEDILALSKYAVSKLLQEGGSTDENIAYIAQMVEVASDVAFPALYDVVLAQLASAITVVDSETLSRFTPLLAPPLHRANDLVLAGHPETQASLQASLVSHTYAGQPSHRPFLAFDRFWRATFGRALDIEYPPDLVELLGIMRAVSADFPAPGLGDSQGTSLETASRPVAGQAGPSRSRSLPRPTETTFPDISSRSYDADHSVLPHESLHESSLEDSLNPLTMRGGARPPSPSLYGIDRRDVPPATSGETTEMEVDVDEIVEETPREVEKLRHRASMASIAASAAEEAERGQARQAQAGAEDARAAAAKGKGKRVREEREEIVIEDSDDEEIVVAARPAAPAKKPSPPPRKKAKASASKSRRTSSSPDTAASDEPAPSARAKPTASSSKKRTTPPLTAESAGDAKKKRKSPATRSKTRKRDGSSSPPLRKSPSPPVEHRSPSPDGSVNVDAADEETVRRFFALPIDTAVQLGKRIGGSTSLRRLMDLGERAKQYVEERLSQTSSPE
ncbi:hypothetical protein JCM10207_006603 [Rhodosporidiobolus poonsookiae]